jgi:hypothetical protein
MPTLARSRLDVADVKPRVKPEPDVIDLCDSDDAAPTPSSRPEPKSAPVRSRRKVADRALLKYEDDDSDATDGPNRADGDGSEESDDDFRGSKRKAVKKGRAASATPGPATDGVASVSESEAKLAGVSAGILSRIQKSLALAKHPGTGEAEAQQALRLATRLMSSQNLTQADLLASSDAEANQARAGMSIVEIVSQTSASPRNESWTNQIAVAVNLFFDVKAYSTSYANRSRLSWTFYGLAVNTVAAAHAFEMVHNQVLTWAYEKAAAKLVSGKTGKNSYCQGVAAGLIALAKKEKKEEMRLAIEAEKKRLDDAHKTEQAQVKKEKERLRDPPQPASVKPEPSEDLSSQSQSGSRSVKLEDVVDEQDVKPSRNGVKQEMSDVDGAGYGRWSEGYGASAFGHTKLEDGMDYDDDDDDAATDRFYDMDDGAHGSDPHGALGEDIKPHFDEALERDIIDLTDDLDTAAASEDIKPKLEPKIEADNGADGAGWHSSGQLMRFRQDAEKIADDYLASQHSGLKLRKRAKTTYKRDSQAFEQGRVDARKIDVKRKRIQN